MRRTPTRFEDRLRAVETVLVVLVALANQLGSRHSDAGQPYRSRLARTLDGGVLRLGLRFEYLNVHENVIVGNCEDEVAGAAQPDLESLLGPLDCAFALVDSQQEATDSNPRENQHIRL